MSDMYYLYWDDSSPEQAHESPEDACSGYLPGEVVELQRATKLPNVFGVWIDSKTFEVFDTEQEAYDRVDMAKQSREDNGQFGVGA